MKINKLVAKNYKSLIETSVEFGGGICVIVGDNEVGKSSLLEAINLGLTGQLNGRSVGYELHPYLFNIDVTNEYLAALKAGEKLYPPKISIELFFDDTMIGSFER